ncbi:hypothetical protein HYC85_024815 [Camellia sinensis]|uniref:Di19 C-terminal domain-containing protein n=1 Tax=Camellia sinensis TaxID=4442 RepID=A0A7J7G988_CAMSI|nr:hypothetical protein HYC85_024815 [Camellia sinensis]
MISTLLDSAVTSMMVIPLRPSLGSVPFVQKRWGSIWLCTLSRNMEASYKLCTKRNCATGVSRSTLSLLRKNSQDEYLDSFVQESSCVVSSSDMDADPLLSSFIYNPPAAEEPEILQPSFTTEANLAKKSSDENMLERNIDPSPLSNKDQEEKAQRCEFVQGLLYSTIFKDDL